MQTDLTQNITAAVNGLLYISESEAPVKLLQWPGINTIEAAQQKAADLNSTKPEAQTLQSPEDFLKPILQMATPEDTVMQDLSERWKSLFALLQKELCDVQVIVGSVKDAHQQMYIVGFGEKGALALHTSAVIT